VQRTDYLFHSENFEIPASSNYQEITKDVELKKVAIGTKIVLRNIFFDFDKATLRPASTAELERLHQLLVDVPSLKIEISGHTDNKGSAEYNKELSENRSKAVVDYLVSKGIAASRLKYAGYAFERPIASNETEEGRQLNRRTEFEIIGN
jgi:outer membrane protein OmpA-like peptidoglycan-associated protein